MAPRLVLDTNVLLDFWVFEDARALPIRQSIQQGRVVALRSAATDAELSEVLARPQFGLAPHRQSAVILEWQALAQPAAHVFAAPWLCTDPRDQKFLDLAHTARATALITKDKALLKLRRRATRDGLTIGTPAQWLATEHARGAESEEPAS